MITLDILVEQETKIPNKQAGTDNDFEFLQFSFSSIHVQVHVYRHDRQHTGTKFMLYVAIVSMCNKYVIQYNCMSRWFTCSSTYTLPLIVNRGLLLVWINHCAMSNSLNHTHSNASSARMAV